MKFMCKNVRSRSSSFSHESKEMYNLSIYMYIKQKCLSVTFSRGVGGAAEGDWEGGQEGWGWAMGKGISMLRETGWVDRKGGDSGTGGGGGGEIYAEGDGEGGISMMECLGGHNFPEQRWVTELVFPI